MTLISQPFGYFTKRESITQQLFNFFYMRLKLTLLQRSFGLPQCLALGFLGGQLHPRFTNINTQLKHLYCGHDPTEYTHYLIKPVGQLDRSLIEDEWPNLQRIIATLALKEMSQSILIKKLCHYTQDLFCSGNCPIDYAYNPK